METDALIQKVYEEVLAVEQQERLLDEMPEKVPPNTRMVLRMVDGIVQARLRELVR